MQTLIALTITVFDSCFFFSLSVWIELFISVIILFDHNNPYIGKQAPYNKKASMDEGLSSPASRGLVGI